MGLVAVLETPEHVATYATHPAHLEYVPWVPVDSGHCLQDQWLTGFNRVHKMREELCEDTLAYDLEF